MSLEESGDGARSGAHRRILPGLERQSALSIELSGHHIQLGEIRPGNWCGELGYFSGIRRASSTVTAGPDTTVARLVLCRFRRADRRRLDRRLPADACFHSDADPRLEVTANNPVVDPEGNMLLLGDITVPLSELSRKHHGVIDFIKSLLGARG
jgi:hypothetical protein